MMKWIMSLIVCMVAVFGVPFSAMATPQSDADAARTTATDDYDCAMAEFMFWSVDYNAITGDANYQNVIDAATRLINLCTLTPDQTTFLNKYNAMRSDLDDSAADNDSALNFIGSGTAGYVGALAQGDTLYNAGSYTAAIASYNTANDYAQSAYDKWVEADGTYVSNAASLYADCVNLLGSI